MSGSSCRTILAWGARLMLGVALGWGFRLVYERKPLVRFATGMVVRAVHRPGEATVSRGAHLQLGRPVYFSLDQIMSATDQTAALRTWREAFVAAPEDVQRQVLQARAEVSPGSLRSLLVHLPTHAAFREELGALLASARDLGADLFDARTVRRSLMELARLDPGLALDGAQAMGDADAEFSVWVVLAEDNPERVIELVKSGQAPPNALLAALQTLAATDIEKAGALALSLPDDQQDKVVRIFTDVLARTRPLEALAMQMGPDGKPDQNWAELIIKRVPGPQALDFLLGLERQHPELLKSCAPWIDRLLQRQVAREPEFVFDWLERVDPHGGGVSQNQAEMLAHLATHDPARAAALAVRWPENSLTKQVAADVAAAWMRREPLAALEWLSNRPNASKWFANEQWAKAVPLDQAPAVAGWLHENGITTATPGYGEASKLVGPWIAGDRDGALAWIHSQPPGPGRSAAVGEAARALVENTSSPEAARLIGSLVENSPTAISWVAVSVDPVKLPLGDRMIAALPQLLSHIPSGEEFPTAVAKHLAHSLREPDTRQRTLEGIAELTDSTQRQQVLNAMVSVGEQSMNLSMARQVAAAMPDAAAARALMERRVSSQFFGH